MGTLITLLNVPLQHQLRHLAAELRVEDRALGRLDVHFQAEERALQALAEPFHLLVYVLFQPRLCGVDLSCDVRVCLLLRIGPGVFAFLPQLRAGCNQEAGARVAYTERGRLWDDTTCTPRDQLGSFSLWINPGLALRFLVCEFRVCRGCRSSGVGPLWRQRGFSTSHVQLSRGLDFRS